MPLAFQKSPCQNFKRSPCQNRTRGGTNWWFTLSTSGPVIMHTPNNFEYHVGAFPVGVGGLNYIRRSGGHPVLWNVLWLGHHNYPTQDFRLDNIEVRGLYSTNNTVGVEGSTNFVYGTLAYHPKVRDGIFATATHAVMYELPLTSLYSGASAVPNPTGGDAVAFWLGKRPSDLPTEDFAFEMYQVYPVDYLPPIGGTGGAGGSGGAGGNGGAGGGDEDII